MGINMFSWSKEITKKISDSGCLTERELSLVEIALRMQDCHQGLLNECLGIDDGEKYFDLQYPNKPHMNNPKNDDSNEHKPLAYQGEGGLW